jgi:RimJ/RimL family protein N-acetyltransferase
MRPWTVVSSPRMTDGAIVTPVTLEGRYVRLEPLTLDHVTLLLVAAAGGRETYAYTFVPGDEATMRKYVSTALQEQELGRALPFVVVDARSCRVVGTTRFGHIEFWPWPEGNVNKRGVAVPDAVEIGWTWLADEAQRTGINTESKLLMLTHAFELWRVHRVRLLTDARNTRSRAAISRLGARFDGVLRGHTVAADGGVRHSACYSILEAEWPAVKRQLEAQLR